MRERIDDSLDAISNLDDGDVCHLLGKLSHHHEVVFWYLFDTQSKGGTWTEEMTNKSLTKNRWEPSRSLCFSGHWNPLLKFSTTALSLHALPFKWLSDGSKWWNWENIRTVVRKRKVSHFWSPNSVPFLLSRGLNKFQSQLLWAIDFPAHPPQHGVENFHFCVSV